MPSTSPPTQKLYLSKRTNGIYYIGYFTDGRLRWKSTRVKRKPEALEILTNFRDLLEEKARPLTLLQFEEEFLTYAKANHAKPSVDIFRIVLNHLKAVAGNCSLSHLKPQHEDLYKTKRLNDGVSPVTVNIELRAIRTMMNIAVRWQRAESNPFAGMQQLPVPERRPTFLTKADFQKLLNLVKQNWLRELIVFAALTGMRRGEILNLRWQNVDLPRKLMYVETNGTFKTKAGKRRVVPMNQAVFALMSQKAVGRGNSDYVFTFKGRQINGSHVTHEFKDYVRKAELDERLHWHSLRHTFASWLVQDGVPLFEVQKLLGHSSTEVTQIYSHLQPEQLHSTVNRISLN